MTTALLFSGGVDSTVLLRQLLQAGQSVQPIYVRAGLFWESVELTAAKQVLQAMPSPRLAPLVTLHIPADDLQPHHWSITGIDVPGFDTRDEAVFVPGRNRLLTHQAALWCQLRQIEQLALALLAANPFPDARPEFFQNLEESLNASMNSSIKIVCPLLQQTKQQIVQSDTTCPWHLTFSCLAPVNQTHCGKCNKCGERRRVFRQVGISDPTYYAAEELACTK
ncbi:MAG: 7-cyano-7-deazaguanine synthase [Pirellulaceae bacterium]|nr:7-cyano-7-deazaguanine synthase [Pirellulaceae bacterium]